MGYAGTGKSFVLSAIEKILKDRKVGFLKLAPTRIAAINIGGQIIHSALAITIVNNSNKSTSFVTSIHRSVDKKDRLKDVEVILIDEISMMSSELFGFMSA